MNSVKIATIRVLRPVRGQQHRQKIIPPHVMSRRRTLVVVVVVGVCGSKTEGAQTGAADDCDGSHIRKTTTNKAAQRKIKRAIHKTSLTGKENAPERSCHAIERCHAAAHSAESQGIKFEGKRTLNGRSLFPWAMCAHTACLSHEHVPRQRAGEFCCHFSKKGQEPKERVLSFAALVHKYDLR